ncbi:MAG: AIR synthase related protein [Candidatus Woesearchaeota archaeon]
MGIDDYIKDVIAAGDEGSKLLAAICAPTLKNSDICDVIQEGMQGIAVINVPEKLYVVIHSATANKHLTDPGTYAASLVDALVDDSRAMGASPVAFSNIIDASTADKTLVEEIGSSLARKANEYRLPILNGELAVLGPRVNEPANITGTMISLAKPGGLNQHAVTKYRAIVLVPDGRTLYMNSDGIGTKSEFYERFKMYERGVDDFLAMVADDAVKIAAKIVAISGIVEAKGRIPKRKIRNWAKRREETLGAKISLRYERMDKRIMGYNEDTKAYNIGGTAVSIIDRGALHQLPRPNPGDALIAIKGGIRSNGITERRKALTKMGEEWGLRGWHETKEGRLFRPYVTTPSIIFYPIFSEMLGRGLASAVYHMSGGAYNGKLARPLAKLGLHATITDLFRPDWRDLAMIASIGSSMTNAYAKYPMGNEGFVVTGKPHDALAYLNSNYLRAKVCGYIDNDGTGVTLTAYNGEQIIFNGGE